MQPQSKKLLVPLREAIRLKHHAYCTFWETCEDTLNSFRQWTVRVLILPIAVLICSVCLLIGCDRPLILVFSAGKQAFCQLIRSICRLISVDYALDWVFSASKQAFCQLICSICLLISVDRALNFVFSAGKKAFCRLIYSICQLISVDHALIFIIAAVLMSRRNPANLQSYPFSLADSEKEVEAIFREKLNSLKSEWAKE